MIGFSYVAKNEQNTVQTILAYGDQPCNPPSLIVRNICSSEGKPANLNTPFAVEWNGTEILPPCQGRSSGPVLSRLLSERASDLRHEGAAFVVTSARGTAVGEFSRPGALRLLDGKRSFQYVLGQSAEVVRIGVARAANIRDLKGRNDRPAARGEHSAQRYGDRQRKHAQRIHPVECPGHPPGTHERSGAEMSFQPECRRAARGRHSLRRFHAPAVRQTARRPCRSTPRSEVTRTRPETPPRRTPRTAPVCELTRKPQGKNLAASPSGSHHARDESSRFFSAAMTNRSKSERLFFNSSFR